MLTIDRLHKVDTIATRIIAALHRGVEWVGDHYEDRLVDAAYKVAEAKAAAIDKAEDKISDLEDAGFALEAYVAEETARLAEKHKAALAALGQKVAAKQDKLRDGLAAAAVALVAAKQAYDAATQDAYEMLGVEVEA